MVCTAPPFRPIPSRARDPASPFLTRAPSSCVLHLLWQAFDDGFESGNASSGQAAVVQAMVVAGAGPAGSRSVADCATGRRAASRRSPPQRPQAAFSQAAGRPPCGDGGRRQAGPRLRWVAAAMERGGQDDGGPRRRRLALGGAFVCRSVFAASTPSVVAASTAGSRWPRRPGERPPRRRERPRHVIWGWEPGGACAGGLGRRGTCRREVYTRAKTRCIQCSQELYTAV